MCKTKCKRSFASYLCAVNLCAVILFAAQGCSRSAAYKKDSSGTAGDSNRGGGRGNLVSRVESMGQPKKRVVIMNFWNDTPVKIADLGEFSADELRRGLHQTQRVIVPTDIKSALSTEDFVQGDKVRVTQLIREGRKLGVAVLVIGRISKAIFRQKGDDVGLLRQKQSLAAIEIEIKVFDVAGGREVAAISKTADAASNSLVALDTADLSSPEFRAELIKTASRNAMDQMVPEIMRSIEKLNWQGHIARVTSGKIYVNAGKLSGLVPGDILRVLTPGDDIYDPVTGAYLGRSQGQLKGTLEVVQFMGGDGAVAEVHTGANFQEGDTVRLY